MSNQTDDEFLARFVETFCKLDGDCSGTIEDPPPDELNAGADVNHPQLILWRPTQIKAEPDELESFYRRLPAKLPPLYEQLITSWRWLEVFLYRIRLFANPPGRGLNGLAENILRDPVFVRHLVGNGFVPFGFDTGDNSNLHVYDPICFDTHHRNEDGDCPIVGFEHEAMLSHDRIGESWLKWKSFRELVADTIDFANVQSNN